MRVSTLLMSVSTSVLVKRRMSKSGVARAASRAIVFRLLVVIGAVKLDDEAGSVAVEVHDEAIYDLLAAPAHTIG